MGIRRSATFTIALLALACGPPGATDRNSEPTITRNAEGVEIVEYTELSQEPTWTLGAQPLLSIGVDAGEQAYMFTDIGDVSLLADGSIVVAARATAEIRVFDDRGALVRSIGRRGQGPGEFQYLATTAVIGDRILTWDVAQRLSTFAMDGELIDTTPTNNLAGNPNVVVWGFFGDGSALASLSRLTFPSGPNLLVVNETFVRWSPGDAPDDVVTFTSADTSRNWVDAALNSSWLVPFAGTAGRTVGRDALYFAPPGSFEYRRFSLDGSLERIVRVNEPTTPITSEIIARHIQEQVDRADESQRDALRASYGAMPFPEQFPLVDELHADTEDRVWVRRYRVPAAETTQVLHIFGPDGLLAGTIHLPDQLELRFATGDRLAGVWRDEMDVQSVRVYAIERP